MSSFTQIGACHVWVGAAAPWSMDELVHDAVRQCLAKASMKLSAVDMVVTVASDVLDGVMVPTRAEIAGSVGRSYLNVPSSAGQALLACDAMIKSAQASSVLLVGWGDLVKFNGQEVRAFQADPFYARPVGATPKALIDLQYAQLLDYGIIAETDIMDFRTEMVGRAWSGETQADDGPLTAINAVGVAAILLHREGEWKAGTSNCPAMIVDAMATRTRPYVPRDRMLDPADWTKEAMSGLPRAAGARPLYFVSGPSPVAELRAAQALSSSDTCFDLARINPTGGGAARDFGPATGLASFADGVSALASGQTDEAIFCDLTGPLGQMVTLCSMSRRLN